jgi:hypothetical protein
MPVILVWQAEIRRIMVQSQPGQISSQDPISKILNTKKGWEGVAQAVECLPSKHEALSLNPSTEKKKNLKV